jgi:hypothetical protein
LILGRERIITGNVTVGPEGALNGETDALLVEGFAAPVALADGEFTPLKGVYSTEGELAGERFHCFGKRFWGFGEKFHKTLYVVSLGTDDPKW